MSLLDYWDTKRPSVKRRKVSAERLEKGESPEKENAPLQENGAVESPAVQDLGTPTLDQADSGLPGDDELPFPQSQTELESSLPALKADSEAIEEYETSHAVTAEQEEEPGLQERMQNGKWRKGKSSIYVDAFNLALETVLDEEAHLFDEAEMEVFHQWRALSYESQYLYACLSSPRDSG